MSPATREYRAWRTRMRPSQQAFQARQCVCGHLRASHSYGARCHALTEDARCECRHFVEVA